MKIGIYDPYLDTLGGGEKYMLAASACLSQNHEVYILWHDRKILEEAAKRFSLDLNKLKLAPNIFSSQISTKKRFFESKAYDAIFYLSDGSLPLVNSKLFVHFQFPVEWVKNNSLFNKLKIHRIEEVICNSQFTKEYIDKTFHINSQVIYPPVDVKNLHADEEKKNIILTVGRLQVNDAGTMYKKQDVLITAFKRIMDEGIKNWKLVVVLSYSEDNKQAFIQLHDMVGEYPIELLSNISYHQLIDTYAQSKIYWHAAGFGENTEKYPHLAEHFGITTVEAMSSGCVPIVFAAGGQKEIVQQGENGFLWENEQELIEQTKMIIANQEKRKEIADQAMKSAKKYSSDIFEKEIKSIFT